MTSIRFFTANPSVDKSTLFVLVLYKGVRYKKGIGVAIVSKYWDTKKQVASVNQRYREGAIVNFEVDKWRKAIDRLIFNISKEVVFIENQKHFWKLVECEISGTPYVQAGNAGSYFTEYFEHVFIPRFSELKSDSRIARFNVALNKVKDFEDSIGKPLKFIDIDIIFYRRFQSYMVTLRHSVNYFGTIVKIVKQVMREAEIIDKLHSNDQYKHSDFKATSKEVDTVYLTVEELKRIYDTQIDDVFLERLYPRAQYSSTESLKSSYTIVKNRFLIGAFTGLRMSDFNRIDRDNINNGRITVVAKKTDQKLVIPIHPIVQDIFNSGFDLTQSLSDAKTRAYIKDICRYASINNVVEIRSNTANEPSSRHYKWELVGTHTARRSFATNAFKAGVPVISIMKITGHKKESEFMKYIRISQEENAEMLAEHHFFKS